MSTTNSVPNEPTDVRDMVQSLAEELRGVKANQAQQLDLLSNVDRGVQEWSGVAEDAQAEEEPEQSDSSARETLRAEDNTAPATETGVIPVGRKSALSKKDPPKTKPILTRPVTRRSR